jgi:hypothetical protein
MRSAIFYAVLSSDPSHEARQTGATFLATIAKLEGNKAVRQLGQFVWEVNFRESPDGLAVLVRACEQLSLPYGILPFDDASQWIRCDPSPK